MGIEFQPIGVIHTPHQQLADMPIQPSAAAGIPGKVEIYPEYPEGLRTGWHDSVRKNMSDQKSDDRFA